MDRKFFVGSVGKPNSDYDDENLARCVEFICHAMHKTTRLADIGAFSDVAQGSVFLLKYKDNLIAYGEVQRITTEEVSDDWSYRVYVREWIFKDKENPKIGIPKYGLGDAHIGGAQYAAIKQVNQDYALAKMKAIDDRSELYARIKAETEHSTNVEDAIKLLEANKNLILTGAPGTGKTYLAKEIAKKMIGLKEGEELKDNEQFAFVQFHPSYDYTDFVEGLRPIKKNDAIGFELTDGVFKDFCRKASGAIDVEHIDQFTLEGYVKYLQPTLTKKTIENYKGRIEQLLGKELKIKKQSMVDREVYSSLDEICDSADDIKDFDLKHNLHGQFSCAVANLINFKESLSHKQHSLNKNKLVFIFIIDEINRGEISKIFGELFFSIDPSYRGEKGSVKTQYSNLHANPEEQFYVPKNVYIIGTMNDIDRSVESFDFAMRRRFTWREITAKESQIMLKGETWEGDAIRRMDSLNKAIWDGTQKESKGIEGLNASYHIGAAYFKNNLPRYEAEGEGKWEKLWQYHLKPLLFEYVRGMPKAKANLDKLENAYNLREVPDENE